MKGVFVVKEAVKVGSALSRDRVHREGRSLSLPATGEEILTCLVGEGYGPEISSVKCTVCVAKHYFPGLLEAHGHHIVVEEIGRCHHHERRRIVNNGTSAGGSKT